MRFWDTWKINKLKRKIKELECDLYHARKGLKDVEKDLRNERYRNTHVPYSQSYIQERVNFLECKAQEANKKYQEERLKRSYEQEKAFEEKKELKKQLKRSEKKIKCLLYTITYIKDTYLDKVDSQMLDLIRFTEMED